MMGDHCPSAAAAHGRIVTSVRRPAEDSPRPRPIRDRIPFSLVPVIEDLGKNRCIVNFTGSHVARNLLE